MARHVSPNVPTVLLVDDPRDDRQMYAEYLRSQRFRAFEIGNTVDALALAPTTDIVVTGIRVSSRRSRRTGSRMTMTLRR